MLNPCLLITSIFLFFNMFLLVGYVDEDVVLVYINQILIDMEKYLREL